MNNAKTAKRAIILGIIFSLFAITFALLHYFKVISNMGLLLAVIYVSYFVGLALFYNGSYNREFGRKTSTITNFIVGAIFVLASTALLIYGFCAGYIDLF